jgi:hypothetical protein
MIAFLQMITAKRPHRTKRIRSQRVGRTREALFKHCDFGSYFLSIWKEFARYMFLRERFSEFYAEGFGEMRERFRRAGENSSFQDAMTEVLKDLKANGVDLSNELPPDFFQSIK